jgi:hypothetical protein
MVVLLGYRPILSCPVSVLEWQPHSCLQYMLFQARTVLSQVRQSDDDDLLAHVPSDGSDSVFIFGHGVETVSQVASLASHRSLRISPGSVDNHFVSFLHH